MAKGRPFWRTALKSGRDNRYMASLPTAPLTEDDYLRLDRQAEIKSEFHDGQMFAMAGGSLNHSLRRHSEGDSLK